jgi:hypothetical protein
MKKPTVLIVLAFLVGLVVGGIGGSALTVVHAVVHAEGPASAKRLAAAVLHPPVGAGLLFQNIKSKRMRDLGVEFLVVDGQVLNTTDASIAVPDIQLSLFNGEAEIQTQTSTPPQASLDGRATLTFTVKQKEPDPHANRFEVTFAARP